MAYRARKTEHTGAKHGRGAYWGTKYEAKRESSKIRRRNWKLELKKAPAIDQQNSTAEFSPAVGR